MFNFKNRFSRPGPFVIVYGGIFAFLMTALQGISMSHEIQGAGDIVILVLASILAGAFWAMGMWFFVWVLNRAAMEKLT